MPALMPPRRIGGRLLVDGVVSEKVPTRALQAMGVDVVVGVDVSADEEDLPAPQDLDSGAEILARAKRITEAHLRASRLALCDLVIRPKVGSFHWLDFSGAMPAVEEGRRAMEEALPILRRILARRRWCPPRHDARRLESRGLFGRPAEEV
ncbi:MAG: hypothetical protein Q9Q13_07075 [Acidobacteriota bacterium]|nr:hypothetical protein [Acidobacteriota bacterium]